MTDRVEDIERAEAEPPKRPYAPPKLHRYGDIREFTRGDATGGSADAGSASL
jgi:hypothetical protein